MELGRGGTNGQEEGKEREREMQEKTLNGCFSSCPYKLRFDSQKKISLQVRKKKEGENQRIWRTIWIKFQIYVPSSSSPSLYLKFNWNETFLWWVFPELSTFKNGRFKRVAKVWDSSTGDLRMWGFILFSFVFKFPQTTLFHFWVWIVYKEVQNIIVRVFPLILLSWWKIGNLRKLGGKRGRFKLPPIT